MLPPLHSYSSVFILNPDPSIRIITAQCSTDTQRGEDRNVIIIAHCWTTEKKREILNHTIIACNQHSYKRLHWCTHTQTLAYTHTAAAKEPESVVVRQTALQRNAAPAQNAFLTKLQRIQFRLTSEISERCRISCVFLQPAQCVWYISGVSNQLLTINVKIILYYINSILISINYIKSNHHFKVYIIYILYVVNLFTNIIIVTFNQLH